MTERSRRLRAFALATLLFVAYTAAVTWIYVTKAEVDLTTHPLDRHRLEYVVLLVAIYGVGMSAYLVALARIR